MLRSRYIKIFLIGAMAFAVSSCTKKKAGDDNQAGEGNMILDDCGGDGYIKRIDEFASVKIPNTAEFSYWACFTDRPTKKPLRGIHFEIEDQDGRRYQTEDNKESDDSGCIKWKEPRRYNHYAKKSGSIEVVRKVISPNLKMWKEVKFYVSPWAAENQNKRDGQKSVVCAKKTTAPPDLIPASNPKAQEAMLMGGGDNDAELWVRNLEVVITKRQRYGTSKREIPKNKDDIKRILDKKDVPDDKEEIGQVIEMDISMKPFAKTFDRNNEEHYETLKDGKFKIFAHLVARDTGPGQNEKMILTNGEMGTIGKIENEILNATLRTNLERKVSLGNVLLVMRLIPIDFTGVKPVDLVYELGDIREFSGSRPGRLSQDCRERDEKKCNMEHVLSGADNWERFKELHLAHPNQSLFFSTVRLRFVTIAAFPPETATRRTVTYSASTCVSDDSGLKMARMPFRVQTLDEKTGEPLNDAGDPSVNQTIDSDDEGCLRWMGNIAHEYYATEEFMPKTVRIQMIGPEKVKVESDPRGIVRDPNDRDAQLTLPTPRKTEEKDAAGTTISFLLNPWDDKFTFGFDTREVSKDFLEKTNKRPKPESLFFTGGFGYHTIRFLYDIDNYMNLEVKKTILLEVDPRVLRYSGIVNARRTTENLRDGIYLLKIGIQKSFLDPAEPSVSIYETPGELGRASLSPNRDTQPEKLAAILKQEDSEVPRREYVTTKSALVRVVDGRLIKPIELTMRDLRLMRVRANFLIELETIDERYLQSYDTLRKLYGETRAREIYSQISALPGYKDLKEIFGEEKAKEIQAEMEKVQRYRDEYKCPDEKVCMKEYLEKNKNSYSAEVIKNYLKQRREQTTERFKRAWDTIDGMLRANAFDLSEIDLPESMATQLGKIFSENDFTKQKLPECDVDDDRCEKFVEKPDPKDKEDKKPYLKPRTFVGPVIFLSNAYSDAVRATDNLDEVCREGNKFLEPWQLARIHDMSEADYRAAYMIPGTDVLKEPTEEEDGPSEPQLFALQPEDDKKDTKILESMPKGAQMISSVRRQNTDYLFTPYYNALSHLCFASVDQLIEQERKQKRWYEKNQRELARIENFVNSFNMDFAVLTENNKKEYQVSHNRLDVEGSTKQLDPRKAKVSTPQDLHRFLMNFDRKKASDGEVETMCRFLVDHAKLGMGELQPVPSANVVSKAARATMGSNYPINFPGLFEMDVYNKCVSRMKTEFDSDASITIDKKLRVFETKSDKYMFKGGLQLNLNVGVNFGVTRGGSRSSSIEAIDLVDGAIAATVGYATFGPPGALAGALLVKPLSFKPSDSMSWSEGTSISTQTYLVAQIAKFELTLKQYEECRVYRLSPTVLEPDAFGYDIPGLKSVIGSDLKMRNKQGITLENIFTRGVMVCSGEMNTTPKPVLENYYYFTQHFTEGDMLDQADMLNNPWLLQLRGDRDFGTFVHTINAQEDVSWWNYYKGAVGLMPTREIEWPLRKLENTYKTTAPSFPGMYTDLPEDQRITAFPINKKIINVGKKFVDKDINGEVCNRPEACPGQFRGYRSQQQFQNMGSPGIKLRE